MKFRIKSLRGPADAELHEADAELELFCSSQGQAIRLIGGATGYESFYVEDFLTHVCERRKNRTYEMSNLMTWIACLGTVGRYDRVIVPDEQLRLAFAAFGIEAPTPCALTPGG